MVKRASSNVDDDILCAAKSGRQEKSKKLVKSGSRSQASMFLIAPEFARKAKVRHRTKKF